MIALIIGVLSTSSCSWVKRVCSAPPPPLPEDVGIQPAPEQQKEAIALLRQVNDMRGTKSPEKEQALPAGEQPQPPIEGAEEEKLPDAPGGESGTEEYLPVPEETEEPVPYEEPPKLQVGSLRDPQTGQADGTKKQTAPRSIDPAKQHGLRSPALPKMLPMDMDGKLNSGI